MAALVGGVLSAIATSLIASCIMWCMLLRRKGKRKDTSSGVQQGKQKPMGALSHELVEYEDPVFNKQEIQSNIAQDNVTYAGNISLQQNVAYEQVHTHQ